MGEIKLNVFAPSKPHEKQLEILKALDQGTRFVLLRAGRKFRKTSLEVSWLFEKALETGLTCPYIAPNRVQAKNIAWDDHIARILTEMRLKGIKYKTNEVELSVTLPRGKVQLLGVENKEALRGISNWGAVACFIAGTKVHTSLGLKNIEDIQVGEYVTTPTGVNKVLRSGKVTNINKLIKVTLSSGDTVTCTPNHHIFTQMGIVSADEMDYNTVVWTKKYHKQLSTRELHLGYKYAIIGRSITEQEEAVRKLSYIDKYGKTITGRSRKVFLSTIRIEISTIIQLITSYVLNGANIRATTLKTDSGLTLSSIDRYQGRTYQSSLNTLGLRREEQNQGNLSRLHNSTHLNGMEARKVGSGTQNKVNETGRIWNGMRRYVNNAIDHIRQFIHIDQDSAPHIVGIDTIDCKKTPVYDLTVEKDHCYFANNILVSNCDEYDDWNDDIWPTIIRPNLLTHKAPAIVAGTPKGYRNMYRLENGGIFKSFHFKSQDNPDLDDKELQELIAEYQKMGMGAYRQEILAEYEKPQGTVYAEWDMNMKYIPFDYDPNLPVHLSWDFGVNDPTAILFIQPNGSELRIFDYYEASDANIEHFVQYIASLPYKTPALETGDIAGRAKELVSGKSPISELARLKHFIRTTSIPNIPVQVRNTHKYIPRIYVSSSNPRCERIRDCFLNYRYPEIKSTVNNQENETPIHDEYSHAMKALEYYCWNTSDPTQQLKVKAPGNSFNTFLKRKEEEKYFQEEYGY